MDVTMTDVAGSQPNEVPEQLIADPSGPPLAELDRDTRHCLRECSPGDFPLAYVPTMVLHILGSCDLDPVDLARLEAACSFFRKPTSFLPGMRLSMSEVAAIEMCEKRDFFILMNPQERDDLKERCGGSWKLVLKYLLAVEACHRRGKLQVVAGNGHTVLVTPQGDVYTFGLNAYGQLGHSTTVDDWRPRRISSLSGIRIVQAAVGSMRTMLVSESGEVYAFGKNRLGEREFIQLDQLDNLDKSSAVTTPTLVESLKGIFVVQVVIGGFFIAVLSREGRVYTICWGDEKKCGHSNNTKDLVPRLLNGALEKVPVVQIGGGHCFLLALAFQPSGMSIYSVGCGQGGKLGHNSLDDEKLPRLIEHFKVLNIQPVAISAGQWHSAVLGHNGRVCTWGWGTRGCLGHGDEAYQDVPKVVEGLGDHKAVHVATGEYTTFVVLENGDCYSFGTSYSSNLGHTDVFDGVQEEAHYVTKPKLVKSLKKLGDRIVQVSMSNNAYTNLGAHTIALTESGKLLAFGRGERGQLGIKLAAEQYGISEPVPINLMQK